MIPVSGLSMHGLWLMRLRRLYFRLSYLIGFPRDFRSGMQGLISFFPEHPGTSQHRNLDPPATTVP
jgi:hypothetical protein